MTDQGEVISKGVSDEVWNKLDEEWGPTAKTFRELNFFRNYRGPYGHYKPPENLEEKEVPVDDQNISLLLNPKEVFVNNEKISLLQIRYGSIPKVNGEQPCLWFLLKHEPDPDGQISQRGLLQISLHIWETTQDKEPAWVPIAQQSPVDVINEATQLGQDMYVLAAKIFDPREWSNIKAELGGKLDQGQPLFVQMQNSQIETGYGHNCKWVVDGRMF